MAAGTQRNRRLAGLVGSPCLGRAPSAKRSSTRMVGHWGCVVPVAARCQLGPAQGLGDGLCSVLPPTGAFHSRRATALNVAPRRRPWLQPPFKISLSVMKLERLLA